MNRIKIWYPNQLFNAEMRDSWFELIKSKERFDRKNSILDANIQNSIEWVEDESFADIYLLPQHWNYYYERKRQNEAIDFCKSAYKKGITVLSTSGGDQGITVPVPNNTIIYRQSGYRSKRKENERTSPFFLSDPVTEFLKIEEEKLFEPEISEKPIVGFCGMAPHGVATGIKEQIQIVKRNLLSLSGRTQGDVQALLSSSNLRYKTLSVFKKSPDFHDNYIIRQKYRGGAQTDENRRKTTEEYYQNQLDSDLIVCVRGVGNFSLRFYESLAMGRIPIFIDTDSPLPDIGNKSWHDYIIWVDSKEIDKAPQIAKDWLSGRDLRQQQRKNRQMWVSHFRGDNFWLKELEKLVP